MEKSNYERMLELADEVFSCRTDPAQLNVDEDVIKRLIQIHPSTVSEYDDGNDPVVWILIIPTTNELMVQFLSKNISEKELFELTPTNIKYDTIYLCSAMVLEEYRGKGIAKKLTIDAINNIKRAHQVNTLFVWPFSKEGDALAAYVANKTQLPLRKRE